MTENNTYNQTSYEIAFPEYWVSKKLKFLASINDETLSETTSPEYEVRYIDISSVDIHAGITHIEEYCFEDAPSRARRIVRDGNIIVSTVRTYLRAIATIKEPPDNLIVSTGFAVIRPMGEFDNNFAAYALRAPYFVDQVVANSTGVSYPAINASSLGDFKLILPPLPEQRAIADFLDHKTATIDTLIEKQERLIALLEEKRSAFIAHAVTKGLDPDVPMKDSGVEWLGEIPAHWEKRKVKDCFYVQLGKMLQPEPKTSSDSQEPYLRTANVFWEGIDVSNIKEMWFSPWEKKIFNLLPGDLVVCEGGDVGRSSIWNGQLDKCYIQNAVHRVRNRHGFETKFLLFWLFTLKKNGYIDLLCNKATISHFTAEKLNNLTFIYPPTKEQKTIVEYIELNNDEIECAVNQSKKIIERLQEYRSSLISSAVIGKIDVRHWQEGQVFSREA